MSIGRGTVALISLAALAGLCLYSLAECPVRPIGDLLADPDRYDGAVMQVTGRLVERGDAGFTIRDRADGAELRVTHCRREEVVRPDDVGSWVTVVGTFRREGRLDHADFHVARGRGMKILVSLPPLLFVGVLLALRFRLRIRRLSAEERTDA